MGHDGELNRRTFLQHAGMTALWGAVGAGTASGAVAAAGAEPVQATFDFDEVYNRFGTDSIKFDRQVRLFGKDSIEVGMGIADMDFRAAPAVTRALKQRLEHENWGYLDNQRMIVDSIIAWNKRRYGVDIEPGQMVISAGVHPALISAMATFCPRGSKVLMTTPVYNGFYSDLRYLQLPAEESPLKLVDGRYSIDFDDFERRISHDTNVFLLCNPQNPTGNVWSADDLLRLGEICLRRRVIVLSDEIHCDFVNKGHTFTSFASLPNKAVVDNSITFKAASKSFGLAAHKVAWFHSTNDELMTRVKANHWVDLNTLGLIANQAAYEGGEDWLNQLVTYIDGTHVFAEQFIKANIPAIKWVKPEGTYLAWLDVTEVAERIGARAQAEAASRAEGRPVTPETMVEHFFVKHAKVHLNQGASYGLGGANHMRMNLATSRKLVERALTNMASALKKT
ncbi:MAG TPA: aminotransferase class I/II-fold pyridoxal phosphate-dependent enzyme [Vicinamibacterales bacterium]|nr:aminotransferase class I/II-fold pyridoxal phosphate-dependent enzyme [Vicinamibacterales bacterium]